MPKNSKKIVPSPSPSTPSPEPRRRRKSAEGEVDLEPQIAALLADPQHEGHPLHAALAALWTRYEEQSAQIARLATISDGYGSMLRERNTRLDERNQRHLRQLQKIVRISDHYQTMLRELNDTLKISASQDPLTGLPNRRLMMERLSAEVALSPRRQSPFALALLDIDHFKSVNDSFGHDVGDYVLVEIARAMNEAVRSYDVCARWGGEEFLILLPEAGTGAPEVCERVRLAIETLPLVAATNRTVTASIGVTTFQSGEDVLETIKRADSALYNAKREGRNRVVALACCGA